MPKVNTVEIMNEFEILNINVKDFCDMKKISTSTFYKYKHFNKTIDIETFSKLNMLIRKRL